MNRSRNLNQSVGLLALLCALTACLLGTGCRDAAHSPGEMTVVAEVTPDPPRVGPAIVALTLTDPEGEPITGASVEVEGNMSHPGMKPVFGTGSEGDPGQYEVPIEFTMGGDWFLIVTATLPDDRRLQKQIDLPGVQSR